MSKEIHQDHIHDNDSQTNFQFFCIPTRVSRDYNFCHSPEVSTSSESSQKQLSLEIEKEQIQLTINQQTQALEFEVSQLFRDMEISYAHHKIDLAYEQALQIKKVNRTIIQNQLSFDQNQLIKKVERQMETVIFYEKIIKQGEWELKKEKKGLKISTIIEQSTVGVLIEADLDVGIEHFFSVLTQIDLMKKWMPFMESSKLQKIVSRNCRIGHCINNFPFISKRQSFFQGIGYDRVDHDGTVLMYSRSIDGNDELQKELGYIVKQTQGAIQLDYKYLVLQYRPITRTSGKLKLAINVDMKLSIPMFILAPATEGFGVDFYQNIRKIAKNFKGSKWQCKIKQNPQFFKFLQNRIHEHFNNKSYKKVQQI